MHLEDVLQHGGTYTMEKYAPQVPSLKFVPETGIDIGNWVKNEAEHIIFVYGEIDPWTAGAFEIDPSRDLHAFIVPGASHGANLAARSLPPESRALALEVLERWTGVEPRTLTTEEQALQANSQALFPPATATNALLSLRGRESRSLRTSPATAAVTTRPPPLAAGRTTGTPYP